MGRRGKKYLLKAKEIEKGKEYPLEEAVRLVRNGSDRKFEETVEVAVALNIRPKEKGEKVRGMVSLPHGTGKKLKVLVFAKGEKAEEVKKRGADWVGGEELVEKIRKGWLDFDAVVATPELMKSVAKLGRILGPRGLMPTPKLGTVTPDPGPMVEELKKGKVEFKNDATGVVHVPIGKISFSEEALKENFEALLSALWKARPETQKGRYIKSISLSSTMGPGIKVSLSSLPVES